MVRGDRGTEAVRGLSLDICAGEIVGIAGVSGNGQRELGEAIAGLRPPARGSVQVDGAELAGRRPPRRAPAGLGYVPEERMRDGVIGDFTVAENLMLVDSDKPAFVHLGFLRRRSVRARAKELVALFDVRTPGIDTPTRNLSGGNIQKLILARELSGDAEGPSHRPAHPGDRCRRRPLHPRAPAPRGSQRHRRCHHLRGPRRGHRHLPPDPGDVRRGHNRRGGPACYDPGGDRADDGRGGGRSVTFIQPTSWPEALEARASHPQAVAIAGGTDVLVELNFGRLHPTALLDLSRIGELRAWSRENGHVRVGSGVTYSEIIAHLAGDLPGLTLAARTVGSPPIRNRGTIGGNLGSASPAGDCHPPLMAARAEVEVASLHRSRTIPISEFFVGPKRSVLGPDELIAAVWLPVATGPQVFAKVGARNAMVIAVCSFALALHPPEHRVGTGIGSAGPVPLPAGEAEQFLEGHLDETGAWGRGPRWPTASLPTLVSWWPKPPAPSTTSGAVLPTGGGRWRSWAGELCRGAGTSTGEARREGVVHGQWRAAQVDGVDPTESLLHLLREHLGLMGTKNACEQGECGSCAVYLDGALVCSCLVLAGQAEGCTVTTVEGLAEGEGLVRVQQAFIDAGAVQCGFCTPGLIMASHDLLGRVGDPDDDEIREALAGNLCRCTGYQKIIEAVHLAARR